VQTRYIAATFKQQEKTLAGLAAARLQLVAEELTPEPFLHDPNEDEALRMERAMQRVLGRLGDSGAMQRAAAGERLSGSEQAMFDRLVRCLRGELDRLQTELVYRLHREQGSIRARIGNMSGNALAISGTVIIGIVVTGAVGYAQNWIWHHDGRHRGHPARTQPSAPSTGQPSSRP
jgi:hypothetical protein